MSDLKGHMKVARVTFTIITSTRATFEGIVDSEQRYTAMLCTEKG